MTASMLIYADEILNKTNETNRKNKLYFLIKNFEIIIISHNDIGIFYTGGRLKKPTECAKTMLMKFLI